MSVGWPSHASTDHPRSRGVYASSGRAPAAGSGSSPLARGLRHLPARPLPGRRIIPARAGFTRWRRARCPRHLDHPRSRGVYGAGGSLHQGDQGSSPLARGLPSAGKPGPLLGGIIPARAGFTLRDPAAGGAAQDHPRSRGVYSASQSMHHMTRGSSPLARGLPLRRRRREGPGGIIPARAGFTLLAPWAHIAQMGSSPLARGLHAGQWGDGDRPGIIPARAGFTPPPTATAAVGVDHPRSRGVYTLAVDAVIPS